MASKRKRSVAEDAATLVPNAPDVVAAPDRPASHRAAGWLPDPVDSRDWSTKRLFGARRGVLPGEASLEQHVSGIRDQLSTSSCVGQALARAIHVRCAKAGTPIPYPSASAAYNFARAIERLNATEPLRDEGSMPRLAMRGLREWGVPAEAAWQFSESTINDELPFDVLQRASAAKVSGWYRVDTLGKERVADVCHALATGYPVILGVECDDALFDYSGGTRVLTRPAGKLYGGHMLCLVGYRTASGLRQVRGVNSWGSGWGDRGLFWADEAWLTDAGAGDLYVLTVTGG